MLNGCQKFSQTGKLNNFFTTKSVKITKASDICVFELRGLCVLRGQMLLQLCRVLCGFLSVQLAFSLRFFYNPGS